MSIKNTENYINIRNWAKAIFALVLCIAIFPVKVGAGG